MANHFFNPTERAYLQDLWRRGTRRERPGSHTGRNLRSNLRKKISVKMVPTLLNHIDDWLLVDRVCREIDGKLRERVTEQVGNNYPRLCELILTWMPPDRMKDLYMLLMARAPSRGTDPPGGGPKLSISAFISYLEGISFDGQAADGTRAEALDRLRSLSEVIAPCRLRAPAVGPYNGLGPPDQGKYALIGVPPELSEDLAWIENYGHALVLEDGGHRIGDTDLRVTVRLKLNPPGSILRYATYEKNNGAEEEAEGLTIDDVVHRIMDRLGRHPLTIIKLDGTDAAHGHEGRTWGAEVLWERRHEPPEALRYWFVWSDMGPELADRFPDATSFQTIKLAKLIGQLERMTRKEDVQGSGRKTRLTDCLDEMEWRGMIMRDEEVFQITPRGRRLEELWVSLNDPELSYRLTLVEDDERSASDD